MDHFGASSSADLVRYFVLQMEPITDPRLFPPANMKEATEVHRINKAPINVATCIVQRGLSKAVKSPMELKTRELKRATEDAEEFENNNVWEVI